MLGWGGGVDPLLEELERDRCCELWPSAHRNPSVPSRSGRGGKKDQDQLVIKHIKRGQQPRQARIVHRVHQYLRPAPIRRIRVSSFLGGTGGGLHAQLAREVAEERAHAQAAHFFRFVCARGALASSVQGPYLGAS